jgi:hypothetical protein
MATSGSLLSIDSRDPLNNHRDTEGTEAIPTHRRTIQDFSCCEVDDSLCVLCASVVQIEGGNSKSEIEPYLIHGFPD